MTSDDKPEAIDVRVGVEGIELRAYHGVYPDERERGSRFVVDVEAMGPWADAMRTDELRDTLDVDAVVRVVVDVGERRRFRLTESLAGAIADRLLQEWPSVREARVRIRKFAFPEWGQGACASAVVTKRRM